MISVTAIPIIKDNYVWLLEHTNGEAVIVDPGDAAPVLEVLRQKNLRLTAILNTHHHWDHVDGINDVLAYADVPVYGPDSSRIPQVTHKVAESDRVTLFSDQSLTLRVIEIPGHTLEHIAYIGELEQRTALFCGDTLFAAGCGRLLGGTAEQLYLSLQTINQLPEDTQVFCTHEYTMANLAFAQAVEPHNQAISERTKREADKREQGLPTVPTSIGLERQTNPFLRCHEAPVALAINHQWQAHWEQPQDLFAGLRRWKDTF